MEINAWSISKNDFWKSIKAVTENKKTDLEINKHKKEKPEVSVAKSDWI